MLLSELLKDVKDSAYRKATTDADFVEQEHPREATGKFTAGSGGAKPSRQEARVGRKEKAAALKKEVEAKGIKIPPGTKIKLRALLKLMEGHVEMKAPEVKKEAPKQEPQKEQPKPVAKKEEPKKEVFKKIAPEKLKSIANNMLADLMRSPEGRHANRYGRKAEITSNGDVEFELRDWGEWRIPNDVPQDEREDYDWEELSEKSHKAMNEFLKRYTNQNPGIKADYNTGEKNWISITLKAK